MRLGFKATMRCSPTGLIAPVLVAMTLCLTATAQTADEIIAKNIAARGLDKLKSVRSVTITGRLEGPVMDSPISVRLKRPNKYRDGLERQRRNRRRDLQDASE